MNETKAPMSPGEAFNAVYGDTNFGTGALRQAFYEVFVAGWNAANKSVIQQWTEDLTETTR